MRPLAPTCRSGGAESVIDYFVASSSLVHILGLAEVHPSAVSTRSIVRIPMQVGCGAKLVEWVRPKTPSLEKAVGPRWRSPADAAAALVKDVQAWTIEQLAGRPATVGSLRSAPGKQAFVDQVWVRWLDMVRGELSKNHVESFSAAAAPYKFQEFDPVERASKGLTRRAGRDAAPGPAYVCSRY